MARQIRCISQSGYYHIIMRGNNRQLLFFDIEDRVKMLRCLRKSGNETETTINIYCLMDNHIHLLIHTNTIPSLFIKKTATSYVSYYNKKYDRVGNLFQDRYKSEAVETDEYLLTVARYILQNPQKANMQSTDAFQWSNWQEIVGKPDLTSFDHITRIAGGKKQFIDFVLQNNSDECMDISENKYLTDAAALEIIREISGENNPLSIKNYSPKEQAEFLKKIKKESISVRQISRLTGLNRNIIREIYSERGI